MSSEQPQLDLEDTGMLCDLTGAFSTADPHHCEAEGAGIYSHRVALNCLFCLRAWRHGSLQQFETGPAYALGQHPT